jgi:protein TonB
MKTISYEHIINQPERVSFAWMQRLGPVPMAAIMTLALLYAMHSLVHMEVPEIIDEPRQKIPGVIAEFPDKIATMENELLPQKPQIIEQPPTLEMEEPVIAKADRDIININPVTTDFPVTPDHGINMGDQPMPIVRINPHYPVNAATRGIEGYVDVMFDITPIGTTTNIRILGFSPSKVFNSSVVKAVRGWKYRPAADEAGAKTTLDVKERITFVLEK